MPAAVPLLLLALSTVPAAPSGAQTPGTIVTIAGATDDHRQGIPAEFSPAGVTVDAAGTLYIADSGNHRIYKIDPAGNLTVIAGGGPTRPARGGDSGDHGPADQAQLASPMAVALDGTGNLFIADRSSHRIRKVDSSGIITTVAGTGSYGCSGDNGPATLAQLGTPTGVAVDTAGNVYIAEWDHSRIRRVDARGIIRTVAGSGTEGYSGDNGSATRAQLCHPRSVTVDGQGNLYIADTDNHRVRRVDVNGIITTVAGDGSMGTPGVNAPAGSLESGIDPYGVAVDPSGNLYIADRRNCRIRKASVQGVVTTVAGTGSYGESGDNGPATTATMGRPVGVTVDTSGSLYIADIDNHRIRKVYGPGLPDPTQPRRLMGDVNGDGRVDVRDVTLALQAIAGLAVLTPWQQAAADVDGDGRVTVVDAMKILRMILKS